MNMEASYFVAKHPDLNETYRYPSGFTDEDLKSALSYQATERDVFVCTFPKNGTTWVQNIIWLILHDGKPFDKKLRSLIPFLEFDGGEKARSTDDGVNMHLMKTHFPYKWIPKHPKAKYIYVVRNPKDTCCSLYYHIKGFAKYYDFEKGTFDTFFDTFASGNTDAADFFPMIEEFYKMCKTDENALFLLYEDLKMNLTAEILKIAKHLGDQYLRKLQEDEKLLDKIAKESSFDAMQKDQTKYINASRPKDQPFIRKGIIGDWKHLLSESQSKILDDKLKKYTEIANLWDQYKEYL